MSSHLSTRLHYQHKSLMDLLDGLGEEQLKTHVIPGKWSILENIIHLQTYQHAFIERIKKILEENNPVFTPYSAEADPLFQENCGKSSKEIILDLLSARKEIIEKTFPLQETDLNKKGTHPAFGPMTLQQWLNFFLLHESYHLFTIFKLAAKLKKV